MLFSVLNDRCRPNILAQRGILAWTDLILPCPRKKKTSTARSSARSNMPDHTTVRDDIKLIWAGAFDKDLAIRRTADLHLHNHDSPLLMVSCTVLISITEGGDAEIVFRREVANVGLKDVHGCHAELWIEHGLAAGKPIRCGAEGKLRVSCDLIRDYANKKDVFIRFIPPLRPLERAQYWYSYYAPGMFRSNHYWDFGVRALTVEAELIISHRTRRLFNSCEVIHESNDGIVREMTPNLTVSQGKSVIEIHWRKRFPETPSTYRVHWSFKDGRSKK